MVVDDAVVVRRLLSRWIGAEPDMMLAACLRTGREAVDQVATCDPDVVVLDVDMPELDGISALPLLLHKKRDLVVIMASTLTRRSAEVSLRALSLGAADYVPKPEAAPDAAMSAAFHSELIDKIRGLGRRGRLPGRDAAIASAREPFPAAGWFGGAPPHNEDVIPRLRPFARSLPRALLIGASTGGPQALTSLIGEVGTTVERAPILITQHMPPTFTTVLAEHLARVSGHHVREAEHDEAVVAGGVYLAPGGRHMRVVRGRDGAPTIALGDDPPINFCKPSVDPFLSSAAAVWGSGALALVLTGMGSDGTRGAADIAAAGGSVIAQDEATSVVWGMPRAVAQAGLCSAVLPLGDMAAKINRLFAGDHA
ncbi:MAG: chemotaxis-specific protein-glutamate methyltransferase CheB [Xanthobacteraceae bacterium]|nr:chemotaxis-specific protein-glutamate methyltransferase CheB [Xanthobacteraceae bacterium]